MIEITVVCDGCGKKEMFIPGDETLAVDKIIKSTGIEVVVVREGSYHLYRGEYCGKCSPLRG